MEQGDILFLRWNLLGTARSGRQVTWPGSGFAHFEGDKVRDSQTFVDPLSLLKQLDLVPHRVWQEWLHHGVVREEGTPAPPIPGRWLLRTGEVPAQRRIVLMPGALLQNGQIHKALEALERFVPLGVLIPGGSLPAQGDPCEMLFEGSDFGIVVVDQHDLILEANPTFLELSGEKLPSVIGSPFSHFLEGLDQAPERRRFRDLSRQTNHHYQAQVSLRQKQRFLRCDLWTTRIERPDSSDLFVRVIQQPDSSKLEDLILQHERHREIWAYDLHDGLAQDLASLSVYLQAERTLAKTSGRELDDPRLEQVRRMHRSVRDLLKDLRNPFKEGVNLATALQEWGQEHGLPIQLDLAPLGAVGARLAYCLITETLSLGLPAPKASVWLQREGGQISAQVKIYASKAARVSLLSALETRCVSLQGNFEWLRSSDAESDYRLRIADPEA